ncbi:MAG TPA: HEAT repeat domain-containing protein [Kofleriaceae bacterium]|nr:HEAT repeat domain-containing protein [Kofleriaceae bacterium]
MCRTLAVAAACLLVCIRVAAADAVATSVRDLGTDGSPRVRLAAALSLSKSKDARAVIALGNAIRHDTDPGIRKICVLALEKMIDARTAADAIDLGMAALEEASSIDKDAKVRDAAQKAVRTLAAFRSSNRKRVVSRGNKPEVFVNIDHTIDQSKQLPAGHSERLAEIVKHSVERTGYATTWPGGTLPTSAELSSSRSRAFIVASTVKKIEITKLGSQTQIACTVAVRVAPWSGKDGGEKWEANRAAQASGSAKAMTGNRDRDIQGGVRDCVEAVAEDVTQRQVVPFLRRIATAGS